MNEHQHGSSGVVPAHRVIVVEDDDLEREHVEQLVRSAGFEVLGIDGACLEADSLGRELEASSAVLINMSPANDSGLARVERLRDLHHAIRIVAYGFDAKMSLRGILAVVPQPLELRAISIALHMVTGMRERPRPTVSLRHNAVRAA
ncbi:MAG TPA: hypothetical protein PLI95_10210 [Polyangiaceae bacterium]|nr:hypothetical protein [Polyangiaceae bacterium]